MKNYNGFTPGQRMKAFRWLLAKYAAGRRTPPTMCDACLTDEGLIQPHSEDYSEPFGDHIGRYGLCYRCHMILHNRFSAPTAFEEYAEALAAGRRYPPIYDQNWGIFCRDHRGRRRIQATIAVGYPLPGFDALLAEGASSTINAEQLTKSARVTDPRAGVITPASPKNRR